MDENVRVAQHSIIMLCIHVKVCASVQADREAAMEQISGLTVRETVEKVAALLGCPTTSEQVAAFLDDHDELRHLRENFFMPKIADLPTCEWTMLFSLIFHNVFPFFVL